MPDPTPSILLEHVSKRFGACCALNDLSLYLSGPQVIGLAGLNGAGKTTLMRVLSGFFPPDGGKVEICGESMARDGGRRARTHIGYLPENAPVYPAMRVEEALAFTAAAHGLHGSSREKAVEAALGCCDLLPLRRHMAGTLSKGCRHRLGLALAAVHSPELLILDEPTDGLDPLQKEAARTLIRNLGQKAMVLVSTHILSEIPGLCDRVLVMKAGRFVWNDVPPPSLRDLLSGNVPAPSGETPA